MFDISETELEKYTVKISHEGGQKHDGSGFFVSPRLILTCAHVCLKYKDKAFKIHHQGQEIKSTINLKFCSEDIETLDIALLEVEDTALQFPFIIMDERVEVGHELYSFGYPDHYETGDVGTFEYIGIDGKGLFKFKEGNVKPGMSGSLLLNLRTKRICGMIAISRDRNQALGGRGIPTRIIFNALVEVKHFQLSCYSRENPFSPLTGTIDDIHKVFGRKSEITRTFELLNSGSGVALIGESGMGKSSLLNVIEAEAGKKLNNPRKVIKINFGDIIEDNDFYDELCYQVGIDCDGNNPLKGVRLKRELSKHRLLLLLDGLRHDMVWEGFTNPVRNQLRSLASDGTDAPLRLVVAANQPLTKLFRDSGYDSPFDNVCIAINLNPWDEIIIGKFIEQRLSNNAIFLEESEIKSIINDSQGYPQRVMRLCYDLYQKKVGNLNSG